MKNLYKQNMGLQYWREQVLRSLLYIFVVFGTITYIPSLIASIKSRLLFVVIIDSFAYFTLLFIFFFRKISYFTRASLLLVIIFLLGFTLIILLGPFGAGALWLFAFPIVSCLLLNKRAAYSAIAVNAAALILLTVMLEAGSLNRFLVARFDLTSWIIIGVNLVCLNIITVYPIALIVSNMEEKLTVEENMIKALKKSQKKIKKSNKELVKTNQELDNFVYRVSHDLRAPLASALGLTNISKMETDPDKKSRYLDLMAVSLTRLDHFITDLIHFSRNSRLEIIPKPIDFNRLINGVLAEVAYLEKSKLVDIAASIEGDEPFYSDQYRMRIIFSNLISNAIKYSRQQHDKSYLKIGVRVDARKAEIVFEDNGLGIQRDHIDRIFDMFFRASDTGSGSGLGLYIAKEAILKLGGKIDATSQVNHGTTFTLVLPNMAPNP